MLIAVTGAAGFLGSHLAERLVAEGHAVRGLDAFTANYARALKEANLAALHGAPSFAIEERDVLAPGLASSLSGCDAVIHLAGRPGVRDGAASAHLRANAGGTVAVMRAARAAGVGRVVVASSSSVYGVAPGPVAEDARPAPLSAYGRSKLIAERAARGAALAAGIDLVVLRLFTLYGPRQRPDMAFARFTEAALTGRAAPLNGDGTQVRDFTYVSDAVAALELAIERGRPGGVYNVAGGEPATVADALSIIAAEAGAEPPLAAGPADPRDPRMTCADTAAARRDLGWEPRVGLAEGLAAQVAAAVAARGAAASAPYTLAM